MEITHHALHVRKACAQCRHEHSTKPLKTRSAGMRGGALQCDSARAALSKLAVRHKIHALMPTVLPRTWLPEASLLPGPWPWVDLLTTPHSWHRTAT